MHRRKREKRKVLAHSDCFALLINVPYHQRVRRETTTTTNRHSIFSHLRLFLHFVRYIEFLETSACLFIPVHSSVTWWLSDVSCFDVLLLISLFCSLKKTPTLHLAYHFPHMDFSTAPSSQIFKWQCNSYFTESYIYFNYFQILILIHTTNDKRSTNSFGAHENIKTPA